MTKDGLAGDAEDDIAQLYIRDVITAASRGSQKFFWFSQDVSMDYDFSVFYGGYVPRPRLVALNGKSSSNLIACLTRFCNFSDISLMQLDACAWHSRGIAVGGPHLLSFVHTSPRYVHTRLRIIGCVRGCSMDQQHSCGHDLAV